MFQRMIPHFILAFSLCYNLNVRNLGFAEEVIDDTVARPLNILIFFWTPVLTIIYKRLKRTKFNSCIVFAILGTSR